MDTAVCMDSVSSRSHCGEKTGGHNLEGSKLNFVWSQVSLLRLPEGGTSGAVQSKGSGYDSDVSVLGGHPRGSSPRGIPRYGFANYDSDVSTRSFAWHA